MANLITDDAEDTDKADDSDEVVSRKIQFVVDGGVGI